MQLQNPPTLPPKGGPFSSVYTMDNFNFFLMRGRRTVTTSGRLRRISRYPTDLVIEVLVTAFTVEELFMIETWQHTPRYLLRRRTLPTGYQYPSILRRAIAAAINERRTRQRSRR